MRIVLDTNIYISAAITSGLSQEILKLAATSNLFTLLTSEEILDELREKRLSKRKIFHLKKDYQRKMSLIFEPTRIVHHVINNNSVGEKMLVVQLQAILPSLKNTLVH